MPKVLIAPMTLAGLETSFLETLRKDGFEPVYPPDGRSDDRSARNPCACRRTVRVLHCLQSTARQVLRSQGIAAHFPVVPDRSSNRERHMTMLR